MLDFTLRMYACLMDSLLHAGYRFLTFEEYCVQKERGDVLPQRFVILRHDIDLMAPNALQVAEIEAARSIHASYYFRAVPQSNQPEIIRAVVALGHEIGYHYEDMSLYHGDAEQSMHHFSRQLAYFRQFYPVKTICMHGSPRSKWDSKDLWKYYQYQDYGVIGEPYFDVDFSQLFYLTDTGRCWDGFHASVRDKIPVYQDQWIAQGLVYHTTKQLIEALHAGELPARLMMTTHPQRWNNHTVAWCAELVLQKIKNIVKRCLLSRKK